MGDTKKDLIQAHRAAADEDHALYGYAVSHTVPGNLVVPLFDWQRRVRALNLDDATTSILGLGELHPTNAWMSATAQACGEANKYFRNTPGLGSFKFELVDVLQKKDLDPKDKDDVDLLRILALRRTDKKGQDFKVIKTTRCFYDSQSFFIDFEPYAKLAEHNGSVKLSAQKLIDALGTDELDVGMLLEQAHGDFMQRSRRLYGEKTEQVSGTRICNAISTALKRHTPVPIKKRGLRFVKKEYRETVHAIESLLEGLEKDTGSDEIEIVAMEMLTGAKNRQLVSKGALREITSQHGKCLDKMNKVLAKHAAGEALTESEVNKVILHADHILAVNQEYIDLLEDEEDNLKSDAKNIRARMRKILSEVDAEPVSEEGQNKPTSIPMRS